MGRTLGVAAHVIVMGVSGCGTSTLAARLASCWVGRGVGHLVHR